MRLWGQAMRAKFKYPTFRETIASNLWIVVLWLMFAFTAGYITHREMRVQAKQVEVWCYSGGHVIAYDVCDDWHNGHGAVQCVNSDGDTLYMQGDCIVSPVGYE